MKKALLFALLTLLFSVLNAQRVGPYVGTGRDIENLIDGLSGESPFGVVLCVDTSGSIDTAATWDPELNHKTVGFGTGTRGTLQVSGTIHVPTATVVGRVYYLYSKGQVLAEPPMSYTVTGNVWCLPLGKCFKSGYLRLEIDQSRIRRVGR